MASGQTQPGYVVISRGKVSPGGPIGAAGHPATTTISGSFNVPAVGATVQVTVADASWMVGGEMLYVANAAGSGLAGALQITAISGNLVTLLNPATISVIPPAD